MSDILISAFIGSVSGIYTLHITLRTVDIDDIKFRDIIACLYFTVAVSVIMALLYRMLIPFIICGAVLIRVIQLLEPRIKQFMVKLHKLGIGR